MKVEQIELQWARIDATKVERGFHSIRISAECIPELYLGIDTFGSRNLILSIPKPHEFRFKGVDKQNLSIDFFKESNHIVLRLVNSSFSDLFNDLILSLYNKICFIADPEEYGKEFIQAFYRWSGFFTNIAGVGLSDDSLKGLFGELILLRDLIHEADSLTVNVVLESWKGPYDATNDFESDERCIEVKTKENSKKHVRISSEFQLAVKPDKVLLLCIISVISDPIIGLTISNLIDSIKELLWEKHGEMSILINALTKKGLFGTALSQYDHLRFRPLKIALYDSTSDLFPKIAQENLASGIFDVSYNLRISQLEEFKISEKEL